MPAPEANVSRHDTVLGATAAARARGVSIPRPHSPPHAVTRQVGGPGTSPCTSDLHGLLRATRRTVWPYRWLLSPHLAIGVQHSQVCLYKSRAGSCPALWGLAPPRFSTPYSRCNRPARYVLPATHLLAGGQPSLLESNLPYRPSLPAPRSLRTTGGESHSDAAPYT